MTHDLEHIKQYIDDEWAKAEDEDTVVVLRCIKALADGSRTYSSFEKKLLKWKDTWTRSVLSCRYRYINVIDALLVYMNR